MKVGDIIKLTVGITGAHNLVSNVAILWRRLPRKDYLEYDWEVFVDNKFIMLGRQIEDSAEVLN